MDTIKPKIKRYTEEFDGCRYYQYIDNIDAPLYYREGLKQLIKVFIDIITHEKSVVTADYILKTYSPGLYSMFPCGLAYRYGYRFEEGIFNISINDIIANLKRWGSQFSGNMPIGPGEIEYNSLRLDFCESKISDNEELNIFVKWLNKIDPNIPRQRIPDGTSYDYRFISFNEFKEHINKEDIRLINL